LTSSYEGTSNTALEAQALGKPVVSPAVGGMPETFVAGTSGFLVCANPSPAEIAESVMRALTDTAWRHQAEQAARAFVRERFSIERMIGDTMELYGFEPAQVARNSHEAAD
jgi:glycosyltransferase involved in cell wall biosynthesis